MLGVVFVLALFAVVYISRAVVVVPAGQTWIVERLGRYHAKFHPGLNVIVPFMDRIAHRFVLHPTDGEVADRCITLDNVPVSFSMRFTRQVVDAERAAYGAANVADFVSALVATAVRNWIRERKWDDARESTRQLEADVVNALSGQTDAVGVRVTAVEVLSIQRV